MIGKIICAIRGHLYRRARRNEDSSLKYCQRCPHTLAVKKRTTTTQGA